MSTFPQTCSADTTEVDMKDDTTSQKSDDLRTKILDTVAASDGFFKHQQRGDPDLTYDEKRKIAEDLLDSNVVLFLQRFARFLCEEHAEYFATIREGNYEIEFYLKDVQKRRANSKRLSVQTKNRRYEALQRLKKDGEYFSDKEMRRRNPLLFEQMVGRYMTEREKQELDKMDVSTVTFSALLMEHMDRTELHSIRRRQQDAEEAAFEENDTDSEEEEHEDFTGGTISSNEKNMLKNEFVNIMYESFLAGNDGDYDYGSVDNNAEFDSLKTCQEDEEEKYFDSEEPQTATME
ncbi:coiled-coil domain-containing protein 97-like [Ornithodoros turicata]|uniref:coiled-coil domain-containing protein 97-like n=1 Tax=Ornithodoros turicata TaxID=34597 RepID=UPI003139837C